MGGEIILYSKRLTCGDKDFSVHRCLRFLYEICIYFIQKIIILLNFY